MNSTMTRATAALAFCIALTTTSIASAFCGFYVSGADASLFNNATNVVLMREGRRTVLSMQNNYQGPPEDFALVIPVPQVLQEENVKTLSDELFSRVDQMAAPRLVEYWEQDPCSPGIPRYAFGAGAAPEAVDMMMEEEADGSGVRVEAQFEVGEYEVVILSSDDSTALDRWLRANEYQIPEGAGPLFRPYIESGMYFFVAKVDVEKVSFGDDGQAMLSPLRFHYDSDDFQLPIRLGLINAGGEQDLLVHVLARGQRYELANYPNVRIPTNIDVSDEVKENFGAFYAALFDEVRAKNEGAAITEYSWDASTCDPCPGVSLTWDDFHTLGADVLGDDEDRGGFGGGFVLTRLHMRYSADDIGEDLVFRAAPPIAGGRGTPDGTQQLDQGAEPAGMNNFQGRYIIKHEWEGPIDCDEPIRGRWGGPWDGRGVGGDGPQTPGRTAFADRDGVQLASVLRENVPAIDFTLSEEEPESDRATESLGSDSNARSSGGKSCSTAFGGATGFGMTLLLLVGILWRRQS